MPPDDRSLLSRREALGMIGAFGALALAACSSAEKSAGVGPRTTAPKPTSSADANVTTCTLTPELTQGPFFLTDHPNASNLVQDRKGSPLRLTLAVVGPECAAVGNVKVDIWQCDAAGVYAGVDSRGGPPAGDGAATRANNETWLQGYQQAGADGTVRFSTIYPGWYPGRAVHIHVKVFEGTHAVHTGQLFFPDALSAEVFAKPPYRGAPDTPNGADSIYADAGSAALLAPERSGAGYAASARLVVGA